ncbi:conserved hypothetical protein [uncultured Alphaproteobacteria bacterium]|uniref:Uncharacterized protein n=1 Tax=uncultured Alphaproteobacteria bacterium TaxID=91750 RepID=A0A212KLW4_9PROT|nr:conserved hypothetical protein [uncultured Alphaproteobacteria bacterium]
MTSITTREIDRSSLIASSVTGATADGSLWQKALASASDDADARQRTIESTLGAKVVTPETAVAAQGLGQSDAAQDFLDYMDKTPEERMRAQILGSMGMTEEELANLPADERKKIEDKIRETIEARIQKDTEEKTAEAAANADKPISAEPAKRDESNVAEPTENGGAGLLPFPFKTAEVDPVTGEKRPDDRAA